MKTIFQFGVKMIFSETAEQGKQVFSQFPIQERTQNVLKVDNNVDI